MDSQRAREILLLHRPHGPEKDDAEVREALEQVERDPALREWFQTHRRRQEQIREGLAGITAPPTLRQRILHAASAPNVADWWRRPGVQVLAAAAVVMVFLSILLLRDRPPGDDSFEAFRNRMIRQAQRAYGMDMETNSLVGIRQYLAGKQWPSDYALPQPLERLEGIGCAALRWRDHRVSLICLGTGGKTDLYLFVIERAALPDPPPVGQPEFKRIGRLTSASWSQAGRTYLLAGEGDEEFVRRFL